MARRKTRTAFRVSVEGMSKVDRMAEGYPAASRLFLERSGQRILENVQKATPKRSGAMARSWIYTVDADGLAVVIANTHPGAKARDRGAWIEPKQRKALRFRAADGTDVFLAGGVKQLPMKFFAKGKRGTGKIMREEFARAMDELGVSGRGDAHAVTTDVPG